jgi:hypothetical protein
MFAVEAAEQNTAVRTVARSKTLKAEQPCLREKWFAPRLPSTAPPVAGVALLHCAPQLLMRSAIHATGSSEVECRFGPGSRA